MRVMTILFKFLKAQSLLDSLAGLGSMWTRLVQSTANFGIKELRFENTERRKKETCKLLITIQADRTYILESGYDTHFSKCILAAIATLTRLYKILSPLLV